MKIFLNDWINFLLNYWIKYGIKYILFNYWF